MHYTIDWFRIVVAVISPMRVDALTFSEQVIASVKYDSGCGMSDVAFRTASPIGGSSCHLLCSDNKLSVHCVIVIQINFLKQPFIFNV